MYVLLAQEPVPYRNFHPRKKLEAISSIQLGSVSRIHGY